MQKNFSIFDIPASDAPAEVKEETNGLRVVCKCSCGFGYSQSDEHLL